ncbi:hypothetical protein TPA0907_63430 [Micromonospora humidisoli]|nr:hypothetical protein TPA0907_63430 [Micromonospora sp. AKA109]
MPIEVGAEAPDFLLKDQNNQEVRLSDYRGNRTVLLVFYPLAFTGICQGELCEVRDNLNDYVNDDVQVLTVKRRLDLRAQDLGREGGLPVPAAGRLLAARGGRPGVRRLQRPRRHRQPGHLRHRQGRHTSGSPE